jgi:3-oxoacyl-[acyl-carrier-protein] synthase II
VRQVVVTGLGAVTSLGADLPASRAALSRGESGLRPATLLDATPFPESRAGEVRDFEPRRHFRAGKALKLTDRRTRFAVAAADMALLDAGFPEGEADREGLGVVLGTSGSDLQMEDLARALGDDPEERAAHDVAGFAGRIQGGLSPLWLLVNLPNMASAHAAIQLGARGPNSTLMTDWSAGLQALGEAADWIRCGQADAVLAGGADTGVIPHAYAGYEQAGLFAQPGFVPAEGAAVLLLEESAHARRRGARPLAELAGAASAAASADGAHLSGALLAALLAALREAGLSAAEVGELALASIHAAPWSSAEASALRQLFGEPPPLLETTSRLGHALAAAGPIELALRLAAGLSGPLLAAAPGFSGHAAALALRPARGDA